MPERRLLHRWAGNCTNELAVTPLGTLNRFLGDIAAIACWAVLWVGSMAVGLKLGKALAGPQGLDGYLALTGIWAVLLIPMAFGCSMLFLRRKLNTFLFLVSAVPVGFFITLWPFLLSWVLP